MHFRSMGHGRSPQRGRDLSVFFADTFTQVCAGHVTNMLGCLEKGAGCLLAADYARNTGDASQTSFRDCV